MRELASATSAVGAVVHALDGVVAAGAGSSASPGPRPCPRRWQAPSRPAQPPRHASSAVSASSASIGRGVRRQVGVASASADCRLRLSVVGGRQRLRRQSLAGSSAVVSGARLSGLNGVCLCGRRVSRRLRVLSSRGCRSPRSRPQRSAFVSASSVPSMRSTVNSGDVLRSEAPRGNNKPEQHARASDPGRCLPCPCWALQTPSVRGTRALFLMLPVGPAHLTTLSVQRASYRHIGRDPRHARAARSRDPCRRFRRRPSSGGRMVGRVDARRSLVAARHARRARRVRRAAY